MGPSAAASGPGPGQSPGASSPSNIEHHILWPSNDPDSSFPSSSSIAKAYSYSTTNSTANSSDWTSYSSTPVPVHVHTTLEMVGLAIKITTFPPIIIAAVFGNLLVRHVPYSNRTLY